MHIYTSIFYTYVRYVAPAVSHSIVKIQYMADMSLYPNTRRKMFCIATYPIISTAACIQWMFATWM